MPVAVAALVGVVVGAEWLQEDCSGAKTQDFTIELVNPPD